MAASSRWVARTSGFWTVSILRQNEAIGAYLRARRAVDDENPETGKEEPKAPAGKSSPGDAAPPAGGPANG